MSAETAAASPHAASKPKAIAPVDKHISGIFILLCIISVIELYSASSREVAGSAMGVMWPIMRHLAMLAGGVGIVVFCSKRHYSDFVYFTVVFSLISAGMMIYVMLFGQEINGARRSLSLLGIGIYPAEMVKLSAVLLTAMVMTFNQDPKEPGITRRGVIWCGFIILFFCALLIRQGLTNTLLLLAISYSMMIIGGVKLKHLLILTGIYAVAAVMFVGVLLLFEKAAQTSVAADGTQQVEAPQSRIATWLARLERHGNDSVPKWEIPPTGKNRQEILSYMAQANGGIHGVGPGNSREASRLPLAFSDYIFAIVVEELGFVGGAIVLILYLWLLGRAAGIASRCTITYPALLVTGLAVMIAFQALFHIAIVTGVAPVSGQPLPLISKGGTSILTTSIAFGIMLSVSRYATRHGNKKQQINEEIEALPEQLRDKNRMQL